VGPIAVIPEARPASFAATTAHRQAVVLPHPQTWASIVLVHHLPPILLTVVMAVTLAQRVCIVQRVVKNVCQYAEMPSWRQAKLATQQLLEIPAHVDKIATVPTR
jgi:hypothetical protein